MKGNQHRTGSSGVGKLEEHPHFRAVKATFEALRIPYWLDQGTLLGVIREGGLLGTDHDLDLGMWEEDYRKRRREILGKLRHRGRFVEAYKPHQLSVTDLHGTLNMINIAFYRREGGRAVKDVYYPVSGRPAQWLIKAVLFCAHAGAGTLEERLAPWRAARAAAAAAKIIPVPLWNFLCYSAGRSQYLFRPFFRMAVDEQFFLRLETVETEGMKLPVPGNPQAYLAYKYGPQWRTPREDWLYYRDDGAIIP